jgi:hypothetical protein
VIVAVSKAACAPPSPTSWAEPNQRLRLVA